MKIASHIIDAAETAALAAVAKPRMRLNHTASDKRVELGIAVRAAIAAVAPLILEEAATIADEIGHGSNVDQGRRTAAAIRSLSPTSHTSPEE